MSDVHFDRVRHALALHLEVPHRMIDLDDRLSEDLGLDPLDLVLVALRLEELESVELPVAELEHVESVRDLVSFVRHRAASRPPRSGTALAAGVADDEALDLDLAFDLARDLEAVGE